MRKYTMTLMIIFGLVLVGCAPRAMDLRQARGLCYSLGSGGKAVNQDTESGGGGCGEGVVICKAMLNDELLAGLDRASCLAACEKSRDVMYAKHVADGCKPYAMRAYELCDMHCRGRGSE